MRFAILYVLVFTFCTNVISQTYPSSNINLLSVTKPGSTAYSGCWGWYQSSKNKEYALVQGQNGYLYFIDVTIPTAPVACDSVFGKPNINREVKTYQNYCYSVSGAASGGTLNCLQIIDMSNLPNPVQVVYSGNTIFSTTHTIWIDKDKLYCASVAHNTIVGSGQRMEVYSLATPSAPLLLRSLNQDYTVNDVVHDMYVRNDTVYASATGLGLLIYYFNGTNFIQLGSLSNYPSAGYNHSSYLTSDGKTLVFCDEVPEGLDIKTADVTNFNNIIIKALFKPNNHPKFVAHNPYILGSKWALISCYQDGLNIYDISNPSQPILKGYFDTYPQGGFNTSDYGMNSFAGNWGAYPYFPSGNILALDMSNGAFMLQMDPAIGLTERYESQAGIIIHQNPISEFVSFELKNKEVGTYTALIKNVVGKTVVSSMSQFDLSNCNRIEVSEIPNGVYFLSIIWRGNYYQQKIVISR